MDLGWTKGSSMKAKEFIIELKKESKPRNFVAKNAKMGGAGQHKDKKLAQKQGDVKHKKDLIPMEAFDFPTSAAAVKQRDTMTRPVSTSTEKVKTFTVDGYTVKFKPDVVEIYYGPDLVYSKDGNYANPTKLQLSGARRIVTHLAHKKKQDTAEGWSDAYVSRRTGQPRTPYSVYIKGKKWKDFENDDHARAVMDKLKAKFKADGRDPETITIAPTDIPEGVAEGADQAKRVFKDKSGKPVGEIGIDPESSLGNSEWYVHHYATGYSVVGFDSAAEAKRELLYVHKHPDAVEGHPSTKEQGVAEASALEKFRKAAAEREKKHDTAEKEMKARHAAGKEDMKGSIDRLEKHLNKDVGEGSFRDDEFRNRERNAGLEDERNNIAVYINKKLWKVFAGKGRADSFEERQHLSNMRVWADKKSAATGKKWEVSLTGAEPTA